MAEMRKGVAEKCMRRVCYLLCWDEERYCWYKYYCGLAYLDAYLKRDTHFIAQLESSASYWAWWRNHWTLREEEWLQGYDKLKQLSVGTCRKSYKALNNPDALAFEIYPNAVALGESYAAMIVHTYNKVTA